MKRLKFEFVYLHEKFKYLLNMRNKTNNIIYKYLENFKQTLEQNLKNHLNKYLKYIKINLMRKIKKNKRKTESFLGYTFIYIINNYFAASFLLILFKLFLSFFFIKNAFYINLSILAILWIIAINFNVYTKITIVFIKILNKLIANTVKNNYEGMSTDEIEDLEEQVTILNNISFYFVFFLVGFRLWIQENKFIYIILNTIFIQLILLNLTFWGITYIYLMLVMLSRVAFFLHLKQATYKEFKKELSYYEPKLNEKNIGIKVNYNNVYLLTYWCLNDLDTELEFDFGYSIHYQMLQSKYYEQCVEGFNHKLPGNEPIINVYNKKQYLFLGFIIIGPGYKIFENIFYKYQWKNVEQIKIASEHICYLEYNEKTEIIRVFVGTTVYKNQPFPKSILHSGIPSNHAYQDNKIQGFAERALELQSALTQNELKKLKLLVENNNSPKIQNTMKSVEIGFDSVDSTLFKVTKVADLCLVSGNVNKLRTKLEKCQYDKNTTEIITINQKCVIYPEGFNNVTTRETLKQLHEIEKQFRNKPIINFLNIAKKMQKEYLLEQSQVEQTNIAAENENID